MPGYIEDRWLKKRPHPQTGERERNALYGKGKRYRVTGIPGVTDRSFHKLATAESWKDNAEMESIQGELYDPRAGDITLRKYVEYHWWPALRAPVSKREAIRHRVFGYILPHIGELPLNRIGPDVVNGWVVSAEVSGLDTETVRTTWRHLSSILQTAHQARRIASNPCRDLSTAHQAGRPGRWNSRWPRCGRA